MLEKLNQIRLSPALFMLFSGMTMTGLVYSPYLLSVGLFGVFGAAVIRSPQAIVKYPRHPVFWMTSLFFIIVLLGFWQIGDLDFWLERLRIKAPFLLLPIAFFITPKLSDKQFYGLLYFWIGVLFITSLGVGIHFFSHREEVLTLMTQGHPIPTPRNHIRLSVGLAMGILSGIYIIHKKVSLFFAFERKILLFITLFLFGFIHFLSVRTGILSLYTAFGLIIFSQTIRYKKYLLGLGLALVLFSLPLVGYKFIPSFKAKIDYMKWDIQMYLKGKGDISADAGRVASLKVGYDLFREHPVTGIGPGNLRAVTQKKFSEKYPDYAEALTPHNQFLYILAGSGLLGIIIFLIGFLYPLFYKKNYRHPLMLGLYGLLFTSFLLEHSIENSLGVAFYAFFVLMMVNYLNGNQRLVKSHF